MRRALIADCKEFSCRHPDAPSTAQRAKSTLRDDRVMTRQQKREGRLA
jgi:hypothetical protein